MNSGPPLPADPGLVAAVIPAGWYRDPWGSAPWRWYDGTEWTPTTSATTEKKPRLASWLSLPVVIGAVPSIPLAAVAAFLSPIAIVLGFFPILIVVPVLIWIDRVEPEPWASRIHAFLWGAFVAGLIGIVSNTVVALSFSQNISAVVSAPLSEELGKMLGVLWAVRRKEVDGVMDGLVYAGWVGLGFAIVEDFGYFAYAEDSGSLLQVFLVRAVLTPFLHPLFTAWSGLAIGLALSKRRSLWSAWWGFPLAVGSHALWNGTLLYSASDSDESTTTLFAVGVVMTAFFGFFVIAGVGLFSLRKRDMRRFQELVPYLTARYELPPTDVALFGDRTVTRAIRKTLPRAERKRFDKRRAAIARLAAMHDKPGSPDSATEGRLLRQLTLAS